MAGDEIYIPKTAHLMVHKPWTTARMANANDLRKAADMLDSVQNAMVAAYMSRAAESIEESAMIALVDAETWMTGDVAAKYFKVITTDMAAAACASDLLPLQPCPR
jgi:ATP-dependent protease ClpP protease subunit